MFTQGQSDTPAHLNEINKIIYHIFILRTIMSLTFQ